MQPSSCIRWAEGGYWEREDLEVAQYIVGSVPAADVLSVEKVAEMLRHIFNDDCACNYNGNDEWLPMKCKYSDTECPMPIERLACWKEFVKYFLVKMDGKGEDNAAD